MRHLWMVLFLLVGCDNYTVYGPNIYTETNPPTVTYQCVVWGWSHEVLRICSTAEECNAYCEKMRRK